MNGDEAWGGNNAPLYVAAYRHIHDLFLAAGATNVIWAWCPNVTDIDGGNKHTMDYYPGEPTSIGPGSMGTTGVRQTVAGRPSNRFSEESIRCLQPGKNRS